ncbi:hypothetical protein Q9G86_14740 [Bacillus thuringiensis]|uniref:hypothetical protein n=1 Tax=Bacillus thuringiensis TaxID=1428 RepID=UPI00273C4C06|nr:hypothetical protein [Bacillus thuringiensis]WLP61929.1 hypothetical protein Q9G86_14740 [Bacillus thuringiensis]
MKNHEKKHETKVQRPLVVVDLVQYRGHQFLVAFLYENRYTIGQIITPIRDFMKDGISIADKLKEIVQVNCNAADEIPFDLFTCNETIFGATLRDPYILTQLKPQADCSECQSVMKEDKVREAIDDLYISEYEAEIKATETQKRSIRNTIRKAYEYVRQKAVDFINWLKV